MPVNHDYLLIVDIEATCWEDRKTPPGERNEIIEIGVCVLDVAQCTVAPAVSLLVQPTRSQVSDFCTQLTSLTPELLAAEGMTFAAACAILERDFGARERLWLSWGNYDRHIFRDQCRDMDVPYPYSEHHANLRKVWGKFNRPGRGLGLKESLESVGLTLTGRQHRGDDDAYNAACLLASMLQTGGLDLLKKYW